MDPQEALSRYITAAAAGDVAGCQEAHHDLMAWLTMGGFTPSDPRE